MKSAISNSFFECHFKSFMLDNQFPELHFNDPKNRSKELLYTGSFTVNF